MRIGAEYAHEWRAQTCRTQYEHIKFKPGETVDDFAVRLQAVVNELGELGDSVDDKKMLLKLFRVVPKKYKQLAWSIESMMDLKEMSLDELVGYLHVVEERDEEDDEQPGGKLFSERRCGRCA